MQSIKINDLYYHFVITGDQSPSLFVSDSKDKTTETMHSKEGAFSESLYIYQYAIEWAVKNNIPLNFFSLGTGLGYNEIGIFAYLCSQDIFDFTVDSFEADTTLTQYFRSFMTCSLLEVPEIFVNSYNKILDLYLKHYKISKDDFFNFTKANLKNIYFHSDFVIDHEVSKKYNVFLYDAYSNQTDLQFWQESSLTQFLNHCSNSRALFTTYAATGALNRALKNSGYTIEKRKGFGKKRESTFAYRLAD